MLRVAIRGLATRKLRGALTALAILIGVAMIAGTLILRDSVNNSFDDIFAEANAGVDVSVRAATETGGGFDLPEAGVALPERLVGKVEGVEGVEQASGTIGDVVSIVILDEDGDRIGPPQGGPPQIANSVQPSPFSPFTYTSGEPPSADGEVAIDSITAEEEGYDVGQEIPISGAEGLRQYTLSGIAQFGTGVPLGGASLAVFTVPRAQAITDKQGEFDEISVEAAAGVDPVDLRDRLRAALPDSAEVKTGTEIAADDSAEIKDGFSFLTTVLLVFAGIALFVGAFLIFNTFSITVAQRKRELGMLRTLGASSRQVLASVIVEALIIGVLASAIGLVAGLGFVKLILALFGAVGFELPQSGTPISGTTVLVALIVGVIATAVSAAIPATRATRVTPLEALSEDIGIERAKPTRRRTAIAAGFGIAGIATIGLGLFAIEDVTPALSIMGLGLMVLFISIAMLGGRLIAPLAAVVGGPIERLRGASGKLARQNVLRNPSRTATTSSALMVGVALVVFVLTLGAALTKSIDDALEQTFAGDLFVQNVDGFSPISKRVSPAISEVEGVAVSSALGASGGVIDGRDELINGLEPETLAQAVNLDWVDGSDQTLAGLGTDGAIVEADWAAENGVEVGDAVEITTPGGDPVTVTVEGSVRDQLSLFVSSVAVPLALLRDRFDARTDLAVIVDFTEGAPAEPTRDRVDELLSSRFPQAEARSQQELRDQNRDHLNQILYLIYALLTLSVLLSLIGVVNTLVLTIYERTREIGMLRAIGASKGQMRTMVRYESLITAMIGAVIGVVVGLLVAVAAVESLESEGLVLAIPIVGIIVVLVLSAIAGVLAGVLPASRAAKVEVMEALQYE